MRTYDLNLAYAHDYLLGIQEALYSTGSVDDLERCFQELCFQLDYDPLLGKTKVEKKNVNRSRHWCMGYQQAILEQMNEQIQNA